MQTRYLSADSILRTVTDDEGDFGWYFPATIFGLFVFIYFFVFIVKQREFTFLIQVVENMSSNVVIIGFLMSLGSYFQRNRCDTDVMIIIKSKRFDGDQIEAGNGEVCPPTSKNSHRLNSERTN